VRCDVHQVVSNEKVFMSRCQKYEIKPPPSRERKPHAHGHASKEIHQDLDPRFLLLRTCKKTCEARDDDTHLDCANERRESMWPEKRNAEELDFGNRC